MSEPEQDVTVEEAGVSVRKSLNDHQFETLAVVFDVRASTDGPATVTITDAVPEDVPDDDIGFHPEYGGEHWHAEEGQVVFSREFGPGEQYTTVYGVRDFDGTRADLLAEPTVGVGDVAEVSAIDDLVSPEDSEVVREVISGERDTLPGLEDEAEAAPEAEPAPDAVEEEPATPETAEAEADGVGDEEPALDEPLPGMGGDESDEVAVEEPMADAAGDGEEDDDVAAEPVGAMAEEADADAAADDGGIADATVALGDDEPAEAADEDEDADDAAGVGAPTAGAEAADTEETTPMAADDAETDESIEAETEPPADADDDSTGVESVMADVGGEGPAEEDDAAEADDEVTVPVTGGIARVLAKELRAGNVSYDDRRLLREELLPEEGSTDARIQHLQNQVADLEAYTEALETFLDEEGGAQAVLDDIEDRVEALADDVAAVEETVADVDDEVYSMADDIEDVEDDVADVSRDVDEVSAEVDSVAGDVDQLEGEMAGLRDDVGRIDAIDRRIEQVEDDVSAIHDELEDLAEFRDRLSSVFGAGGGMGGDDDADDDF